MSRTPEADRGRSRFDVTPELEGQGVFKRGGGTQVAVVLVSVIAHTSLGDVSVRGYVNGSE